MNVSVLVGLLLCLLYACTSISNADNYLCTCVYVCMYVCMYGCVCAYVRMYVCMYTCMYVYMYAFMYVFIYVLCMYLFMCVLIFLNLPDPCNRCYRMSACD